MSRVKRGIRTRARHKKILKQAKGYFGKKSKLFKVANQQVLKSGNYAYRDRRNKKRDFRSFGSQESMLQQDLTVCLTQDSWMVLRRLV